MHPGLVAHGNPSKGWGTSQLSKDNSKEREAPSTTIGTQRLQVPIPPALRDLVPIFTCHMLGTTCQSSTYFFFLPLTQRLMSSGQN